MSSIPVNTDPDPAGTKTERQGLWRRVAQALDQYFVDRARRAVPEVTLRRSKHEVARCRRLMLKGTMAPAEARLGRALPQRTARRIHSQ